MQSHRPRPDPRPGQRTGAATEEYEEISHGPPLPLQTIGDFAFLHGAGFDNAPHGFGDIDRGGAGARAYAAVEHQIEFPILYANARAGWASTDPDVEGSDLKPLCELVLERIPAPNGATAIGDACEIKAVPG